MIYLEETAVKMKKILLVDRDDRARAGNALRLEFLELEVLQAATAEEALEQLNRNPELIVTEMGLSGEAKAVEFYKRLKEGKAPVVFLTSGGDGTQDLVSSGVLKFAVISKQNRKEMVDQVSKFLKEGLSGPESSGSKRKPRQILVVEDSLTLRGVVRRVLEKYFPEDEIREAEDGRQAMSQMSQKKVDLIITDLEMPGMDGLTFLNHLKNNSILSRKPVLVFSGNISEVLREEASKIPNLRFLAKPASPEKIAEEVSALLGA